MKGKGKIKEKGEWNNKMYGKRWKRQEKIGKRDTK